MTRGGTTLRLRLTLLATLITAVTAALAVAVLALSLASSVRSNLDAALTSYATSVAASRTGESWPHPLPPSPGDPGAWAQVLDAQGDVVASTANVAGLPALYHITSPGAAPVRTGADTARTGEDERVVAVADGAYTVYAGSSAPLLSVLNGELQAHLLLAVPIILAGGLATAWLLIGRALRPVEKMRAEAAAITAEDLHRRIPEPAARDELGRLARTLNTMLARLEDSAARQRRFVSDASHELRTPLAAVRTSLEVGLAHPDTAPWPTLATRAVEETTRLQRLVDDLLTAAKSEAGTLIRAEETIDLAELARTVAHSAASRIPIVVNAESTAVRGDRDALTRVLRNLLENATRHADTTVRITVRSDAHHALLTVADDGPGIPEDQREHVFDRFVRLQADRTRPPGQTTGTGLGLSIAREIVTAHHGHIEIGDAHPGTIVTVRLPTAG